MGKKEKNFQKFLKDKIKTRKKLEQKRLFKLLKTLTVNQESSIKGEDLISE